MRERELYKLYEREVWAMNIIMAQTNEPIVSGNNETILHLLSLSSMIW